ncbi:MAG TPA: DUF1653 domain-containing protein [Patescibacteria group bacterium]|jgi:hypothetical protein|nr:DUF1653 domain-containing protein [Patescibacteria group bacterium]
MVKPGIYEHYKGGEYEVIAEGLIESTEEPAVIYKALYAHPKSLYWVRSVTSFEEQVEWGGETVPRFKFIKESPDESPAI